MFSVDLCQKKLGRPWRKRLDVYDLTYTFAKRTYPNPTDTRDVCVEIETNYEIAINLFFKLLRVTVTLVDVEKYTSVIVTKIDKGKKQNIR